MPSASISVRTAAAPKVSPKKKSAKSLSARQPGMGAVPHAAGTTFRVWAPHAEAVSIIGTFNNWQSTQTPLEHEAGGYWAVDVPDAQPGDE
jgi:1,4-alpha-glucan branching enzyme